jgi:hypothetical protein
MDSVCAFREELEGLGSTLPPTHPERTQNKVPRHRGGLKLSTQ